MSDPVNNKPRLGPETARKIAIVGAAPSSAQLAPFNDPEWAIWGCSPACFAQLAGKRVDVWFELHRWMPYQPGQSQAAGVKPWFSPEYTQYLASLPTVFFTEPQPKIPGAQVFPYQELIAQYGPYHFTSSISLMIAYALNCAPEAIALYGIDMAATEEYAYQRPGCQHFVGLAKSMGIEVILPAESDLMRHTTIYGLGEHNSRFVKLEARLREIEANRAQAQQTIAQASAIMQQCDGAIMTLKYMMDVWSDDLMPSIEQAVSFSGMHTRKGLGFAPLQEERPPLRVVPAAPTTEVDPEVPAFLRKVEGERLPEGASDVLLGKEGNG